jgi:hypothetical protein
MSGKCYAEKYKMEAEKQSVERGHSVSNVTTCPGILHQ